MLHEETFFEEISGLTEAKLSLLIFLVAPTIKSLVLTGLTGTGKSSLTRLAGTITGEKVVHLPLHATGDRVFGSIDISRSITRGEKIFEPGILKDVDGGILLIDDIHLMNHSLITSLCTAAETGHVIIEREGISSEYKTNFRILATLNPEEGELTPHLLDRFSLCALCQTITDPGLRKQVIITALKNRSTYKNSRNQRTTDTEDENKDESESANESANQNKGQKELLCSARQRYPYVIISEGLLDLIANLGRELAVEGHRGEIAHAGAARALAALNGRDQVNIDDISQTAQLALQHRKRDDQRKQNPPPESDTGQNETGDNSTEQERENSEQTEHPSENQNDGSPPPDQVFTVGDPFLSSDILSCPGREISFSSGKTGKKGTLQKRSDSGRYFRSRIPTEAITDIAFDATIRAAAPYQKVRPKGETALTLTVQDIRVKERKRKSGRTLIFVVDSSGSMGAAKRMTVVKGAVLSLLKDAYISRDQVALIAFRGTRAEILLQPTRSGTLAYRQLADLPTGGKTPLSLGIHKSTSLIRKVRRKNCNDKPLVIFISDGRANYSLSGQDPIAEANIAASMLRNEKASHLIIDAEYGYPRLHLAKKLAENMGGKYAHLDTLSGDGIVNLIRKERN